MQVAAESYIGDEARIVSGNPDAVFATAKHVVEGELRIGGQVLSPNPKP